MSVAERTRPEWLAALHVVARLLYRVSGWLVIAALAVITILVFLRVFSRNVYPLPIVWAAEVTTYLQIWLIFVGGSMALRDGEIAAFTLLAAKLPRVPALLTSIAVDLLLSFFFVVCIIENQTIIRLGLRQTSPVLEMPMAYVSVALTVGFALSTYYLALRIVDTAMSLAERRPA